MKVSTRPSQQPLRCCICHGEEQEALVSCEGCGTRHHIDCIESHATCPTIGCGAPVQPKEKCYNCKGLGRELVGGMCRSHWYDCNRCGGTGYRPKRVVAEPKEPSIIPTARGLAVAEALKEAPRWSGRRYESFDLNGPCMWCWLLEGFHAGTENLCPINAEALRAESDVRYREMCEQERSCVARQEARRRDRLDTIKTVLFLTFIATLAFIPCLLAYFLDQ